MKLCDFIRINGTLYRVLDQAVEMERGMIVADITVTPSAVLQEAVTDAMAAFLVREQPDQPWKTPANPALWELREYPPRVLSSGTME